MRSSRPASDQGQLHLRPPRLGGETSARTYRFLARLAWVSMTTSACSVFAGPDRSFDELLEQEGSSTSPISRACSPTRIRRTASLLGRHRVSDIVGSICPPWRSFICAASPVAPAAPPARGGGGSRTPRRSSQRRHTRRRKQLAMRSRARAQWKPSPFRQRPHRHLRQVPAEGSRALSMLPQDARSYNARWF